MEKSDSEHVHATPKPLNS